MQRSRRACSSRWKVLLAMFAALGWFYLSVLQIWRASRVPAPIPVANQSVLIFLGISAALAGYLSRGGSAKDQGRNWYGSHFLPKVGPSLYGLLFTIVILFALQGDQITSRPLDVTCVRCRCWPTSPHVGRRLPAGQLAAADVEAHGYWRSL